MIRFLFLMAYAFCSIENEGREPVRRIVERENCRERHKWLDYQGIIDWIWRLVSWNEGQKEGGMGNSWISVLGDGVDKDASY